MSWKLRAAFLLFPCLLVAAAKGADDVRRVDLICNSLVYDPVSARIYASVPGSAGRGGNSVVPINPETGQVGEPILVGSEPSGMAVSSDGKYLYVALNGNGEVRRIDLTTRKAGLQFPVGGVRQLAVVPGDRDLLIVSRGEAAGHGGGVAAFRDGVLLPKTAGPNTFALGFGPSVYTYQNEISSWDFGTNAVGATGLIGRRHSGSVISANLAIIGDGNGRVYTSNGQVLDPENYRVLGRLPNTGFGHRPLPDPAHGKIFYLEGDKITVSDYNRFVLLDTVTVPGIGRGSTGSLIRWGKDGLAFRTDKQIVLLRSPVVGEPVTPADLSLTAWHQPVKVTVGRPATYTLKVTNLGPGAANGIVLTQSLPSDLQFCAARGKNGELCRLINGVVTAELGTLKKGETATVTVELTPVGDKKFTTTAIVRGNEPDPRPGNNAAVDELDNTR